MSYERIIARIMWNFGGPISLPYAVYIRKNIPEYASKQNETKTNTKPAVF